MKNHLTTAENIKTNVRFVSEHFDNDRIEPFINESEQIHIKKQIGEALFIDLLTYVASENKTSFPDYSILLNGGTYENKCKEARSINGLVSALNYYVFAKMIKIGDSIMTRSGNRIKLDNNSTPLDLKDRLVQEKEALIIADSYMAECLLYLKTNRNQFPKFTKGNQRNRLNISIIGD